MPKLRSNLGHIDLHAKKCVTVTYTMWTIKAQWAYFCLTCWRSHRRWDFQMAMCPSSVRPSASTILKIMARFFVNWGIWSLYGPYDPPRWPSLPDRNLGHRDLLSLRYRSKRVFLKWPLIWPLMVKYQMYLTFWTPLGLIDLHFMNKVTVTYFHWDIGQTLFSMHWPVNGGTFFR